MGTNCSGLCKAGKGRLGLDDVTLHSSSQNWSPINRVSVSPEKLLEMQILRPYPDLDQKFWR